jgi:hypothetical protein
MKYNRFVLKVEDEIAEVLMAGLKKLKTKFSRNDVIKAFHDPEYDQEMVYN